MQTGLAHSPATAPRPPAADDVDAIREQLLARGFLYDDPAAYRDGVLAALNAIHQQAAAGR
ncbi:MAG TPA: hypothetical protein VGB64_02225 [Actinomycetota bacterium]